jgi:clostripain
MTHTFRRLGPVHGALLLAALLLAALLLACSAREAPAVRPAPESQKPAREGERPWTILVYGAADNDADGPILSFLDSVRTAIDDDPGIELLLFLDRSERYSSDARSLGEDFTGTRLYRLRKQTAERLAGGAELPEITLDSEVELDSADAANIGRFVRWGKAHYPARRYGLLIYSHANGRTMCPDEQSGRQMGIAELTDDVGAEASVDFLALELCNMGGIEIAYQWRPGTGRFGTDVLLAIPNVGPPLDWDRAFARIRSQGHGAEADRRLDPATMTALDFGRLVIEEAQRGRFASARRGEPVDRESAACYDLRAAAAVKRTVDAFGAAMSTSDPTTAFLRLRGARGPAMTYADDGTFIDLYDLASRAAADEQLADAARSAARAVMTSVDDLVVASFGMPGYERFQPGKNGVFITLPSAESDRSKLFAWYTPAPGVGRHHGRWAFLADGATPGNGVVESWFEMIDAWLDGPIDSAGGNAYRP